MGIEDPDVAEQHIPVEAASDDEYDAEPVREQPPWEADPADVFEQLLVVPAEDPEPFP
jgi:hypothetical protein